MAIPTPTYAPAATIVGRQSIVTLTIGGTPTSLLVQLVDYMPSAEYGRLKAPGASNGPGYTARVWQKAISEILKVKTEEVEKLRALLGSYVGIKTGTCTAWIRDPDDSAVAAYKSDDFACSIYLDPATIQFAGDNPAEATLCIESLKDGAIAWDDDAVLT